MTKKTGIAIITALVILCGIIGFGAAEDTADNIVSDSLTFGEKVPVEIFIDYQNSDAMLSGILQFPEVTYIPDEKILKFIYKLFGPNSDASGNPIEISPNACSCIYVPGDTKLGTKTLMGRNLDLNQSVCPAWIFYTNIPGKYKSFNMGYLGVALWLVGLPTMDEVREDPEIYLATLNLLTYITTDAINEKGLVIEVNMRNKNDKLVTTGTNPKSDIKVCNATLIRYLIDRCATIDDVLKLVKEIDIYSPSLLDFQFALSMMDATGRCGVMEFVGNEIVWHDSSDENFWGEDNPGHTNYWITPEADAISNSCNGKGRYDSLQANTKNITSKSEMWDALSKVYRKQYFTKYADEIPYDIVTDSSKNFYYLLEEVLDYEKEGLITLDPAKVQEVRDILDKNPEYKEKAWDRDFLTKPENHDDIITCYNFITDATRQMIQTSPKMEILKENTFCEYSIVSYVAESGSTELKVKFFENPEIYTFGFPQNPVTPTTTTKRSTSIVSFSGSKEGNDFVFSNAVVVTKATLPGATSARIINNGSGNGWYKFTLSTDGFIGNGTLYFQVPLDVIEIKKWTVNDVSLFGSTTKYLGNEGQYAKYSATVEKDGTYTIGFEENAAANQSALTESKPKVTVSLSGPSSIKLGDTNVLTAKDTDDPSAAFIWQSSNSSIAEVNQNGEVHGMNVGTVTISATNSITGETVSKKVTVEMASPPSIPETTTPVTKPTTTKSPFPVLGILAGLGGAAVLVMRRRL